MLVLLAGACYQLAASGDLGLWVGLQGAAIGVALAFPLYLFAGLGGGDLKLLSASGMLLGPVLLPEAAFYAVVSGGLGAVMVILVSRRRRATVRRWASSIGFAPGLPAEPCPGDPGKQRMPMAPAAGVGILVVILQSAEFARIFKLEHFSDLIQWMS